MFTKPRATDVADKSKVQDLVRFELFVSRYCIENRTIQRLRANRSHSEDDLRVIGLLAYLTERAGYHYGPELLHHLLQSMDDDSEEFAVSMLEEKLRGLRSKETHPQMPETA